MNELIPLTEHAGVNAVMARDLYQFLGVKEQYADWMRRMITYGFEEGRDYSSQKPEAGATSGFVPGGNRTDHIISLDMAKEIAMIQRTEKGKQARQYFIEVEKRHRQAQPVMTGKELMAAALIEADATIQELEQKNTELAPQGAVVGSPGRAGWGLLRGGSGEGAVPRPEYPGRQESAVREAARAGLDLPHPGQARPLGGLPRQGHQHRAAHAQTFVAVLQRADGGVGAAGADDPHHPEGAARAAPASRRHHPTRTHLVKPHHHTRSKTMSTNLKSHEYYQRAEAGHEARWEFTRAVEELYFNGGENRFLVLMKAVGELADEVAACHGSEAKLVFNDLLNEIDPAWSAKLSG